MLGSIVCCVGSRAWQPTGTCLPSSPGSGSFQGQAQGVDIHSCLSLGLAQPIPKTGLDTWDRRDTQTAFTYTLGRSLSAETPLPSNMFSGLAQLQPRTCDRSPASAAPHHSAGHWRRDYRAREDTGTLARLPKCCERENGDWVCSNCGSGSCWLLASPGRPPAFRTTALSPAVPVRRDLVTSTGQEHGDMDTSGSARSPGAVPAHTQDVTSMALQ